MLNMREGYNLYKIGIGENLWEIPADLAMNFGLKDGQKANLNFGSLSTQVTALTRYINSIGISKNTLNNLRIPEGLTLGIKSEGAGSFRLGPVIGILTYPHVFAHKEFTRYIPYAVKMKTFGLVYVFSPGSINPGSKTIKGYCYNDSQKSWQPHEFPFPDVVINRIYPNIIKTRLKLESVMGQNRIFNKETLIDKIEFFRALAKDSILRNHVPETMLFYTAAELKHMLDKHPGIFLKPVNGMKGKGIIQVARKDNCLFCRYMKGKDPLSERINKYRDIVDIVKRVSKGTKRYIVQAEIPRMDYKDRPFGFRIMVVKNASGQWEAPAVFAKIADSAGFLTNNSAGANIIFLKDLFGGIKNKLPCPKDQFLHLLSDLSIKTAAVLDKKFGPLGKLGIDIVVDAAGKPWLIEANGNPGLMPMAALSEYPAWRSQMYDYPLAYCLYLSGFSHLQNVFPR